MKVHYVQVYWPTSRSATIHHAKQSYCSPWEDVRSIPYKPRGSGRSLAQEMIRGI